MNDYTQPFFVRGTKGTFCGARYGYLPPLELPREEKEIAYADMQWTDRQWHRVEQVIGEMRYLRDKYQEASEKKPSGKLFISKET